VEREQQPVADPQAAPALESLEVAALRDERREGERAPSDDGVVGGLLQREAVGDQPQRRGLRLEVDEVEQLEAEQRARAARHRPQRGDDDAQRDDVASPPLLQPKQEQERERQEVHRLELNVQEVREVVRPEAPREAGDIRAAFRPERAPHEHVHRQRARHQGRKQQHVVAEHHVVGDGVDWREHRALQQQVIAVGERRRRRVKDVGVEHAAGEHVEGM